MSVSHAQTSTELYGILPMCELVVFLTRIVLNVLIKHFTVFGPRIASQSIGDSIVIICFLDCRALNSITFNLPVHASVITALILAIVC